MRLWVWLYIYIFVCLPNRGSSQAWAPNDNTKDFFYSIDCASVDMTDDKITYGVRTYEGTTIGETANTWCTNVLTADWLNPKILVTNPTLAGGSRTGDATFTAHDSSYSSTRMKACCGPNGEVTCDKGCFSVGNNCVIRIWGKEKRLFMVTKCTACILKQCDNICPNGKYAAAYPTLDPIHQFSEKESECIPCAPGTFNTCIFAATCTW